MSLQFTSSDRNIYLSKVWFSITTVLLQWLERNTFIRFTFYGMNETKQLYARGDFHSLVSLIVSESRLQTLDLSSRSRDFSFQSYQTRVSVNLSPLFLLGSSAILTSQASHGLGSPGTSLNVLMAGCVWKFMSLDWDEWTSYHSGPIASNSIEEPKRVVNHPHWCPVKLSVLWLSSVLHLIVCQYLCLSLYICLSTFTISVSVFFFVF